MVKILWRLYAISVEDAVIRVRAVISTVVFLGY